MAAENYEKCLETILHHEGGYVNHPSDPGGMTNMGVTKRVYDEFYDTDADENTMMNLEFEDVAPIYRRNYWDRMKCDDMPTGLDLVVFDWGVNSGTGRAAKKLQELIGCIPDGGVGPQTLSFLERFVESEGIENTINAYSQMRQEFYESLDTFETFGKGWTRRVDETRTLAMEMID